MQHASPAHRPATDLVVVGAGIVGLAHAVEAIDRGLRVTVIDRDERPVGASARNFGHVCLTAQTGRARAYAERARETWLALSAKAGFWLGEVGTVVVARHDDELDVLDEFGQGLPDDQVRPLGRAEVRSLLGVDADAVGGAHLPRDLRVDPGEVLDSLIRYLTDHGVTFRWGTTLLGVADGEVLTSGGRLSTGGTVVAVGHDVDRLFPAVARDWGVRRCQLQMLEVVNPGPRAIEPAVLTGASLLRYSGLRNQPSAERVRRRFEEHEPQMLRHGINLMLTARPDGHLVLGDSHTYATTVTPFVPEEIPELLLSQGARLLDADRLRVHRRWTGVYAASELTDFLIASPSPTVRIASVTSGIGMTTAFGLAPDVLDSLQY